MSNRIRLSVIVFALLALFVTVVSAEFSVYEDEFLSESLASTCSVSGYPTYKQCDKRWRNNRLGSSSTICKVGCLMTSVASGQAKFGKKIKGKKATPATLNAYLRSNGGYHDNLFVWGAVTRLGVKYVGKTGSHAQIRKAVCSKKNIVVLNVNNGGHWVLAKGVTGNGYRVMEPGGYKRTTYPRSAVVQAAIYKAK